ncbi:uncharacterized protein RMCC_2737 [Mycolicibacterium canariasense]|uniref:Uncharacterized protein n=1 Tax=Mycolicibacterium canariasense TaxID=228230 RepID=A0A100WCK9_MYCCR|nr:hypothetical protein [Mycolicibacterium canariasense]ORU97158.1 hypothetical protein AWB94_30965 [Mycolicibacterium canariasense]GAS95771.1 uncharacterized protein RMCC_2737 [Mycolicibacterium canariasense]
MHLQPKRVVAAITVRLTREEAAEVDQHNAWWVDPSEDFADGLTAVPDRLKVTHRSIIRSNSGV